MKKLKSFLFLALTLTLFSQSIVETADLKLVVEDIKTADQNLRKLLEQTGAKVNSLNNNFQTQNISTEIICNKADFDKLINSLLEFGYVDNYKRNIVDSQANTDQLAISKSFNEKQLADVIKEMSSIDKNSYRTIYDSFYKRKTELENEIFRLEKEQNELNLKVKNFTIKLEILQKKLYNYDEQSSNLWQFVNMPGLEGIYLNVENPEKGLSVKNYAGPTVKYLFTKGKSYAFFGALKAIGSTDSTEVKDIFYYGVGHDFYPRYLGDGKGKYFNLHSGFSYGGMLTYSADKNKYQMFFITPHIGLELYKSTNVLLDLKAGYLIPMEEKYHYNFRGLMLNCSFNFVF